MISFFYHLDISIQVAVYVDFDADTKIDVVVGVDDDVGNFANFDGDEDAWWSPPCRRQDPLPPSLLANVQMSLLTTLPHNTLPIANALLSKYTTNIHFTAP